MKKQFTQKELVDFGNYLLSDKREGTIKEKANIKLVHDCDIANFKINIPTDKDVIDACIEQIKDANFYPNYIDDSQFNPK